MLMVEVFALGKELFKFTLDAIIVDVLKSSCPNILLSKYSLSALNPLFDDFDVIIRAVIIPPQRFSFSSLLGLKNPLMICSVISFFDASFPRLIG